MQLTRPEAERNSLQFRELWELLKFQESEQFRKFQQFQKWHQKELCTLDPPEREESTHGLGSAVLTTALSRPELLHGPKRCKWPGGGALGLRSPSEIRGWRVI